MSHSDERLPTTASASQVSAFLHQLATTPRKPKGPGRGRLLFVMDATASREPTWKQALRIQAEMFQQTAAMGGLEIQLGYYRGLHELQVTPWLTGADQLAGAMGRVHCEAGQTQIERVLRHTLEEARKQRLNALVFIGDCIEESADTLVGLAGQLGLQGIPVFVFHEGRDLTAERSFRAIARVSGGAYCRFDANSPQQLRDLLAAVAVYAAGGPTALSDFATRRPGLPAALMRQLPHGTARGSD